MNNYDITKIRNFSIVAHIDHGKSTLADRLLEYTKTLPKPLLRPQILDTLELERERGITIKAHPIRMDYKSYVLNLIDTPGHVDFSYEVSRSIAATEGVVLLVDASQGVEAQTLAHTILAKKLNKPIIPALNKIDLPNLDLDWVLSQITGILKLEVDDILLLSGKENIGIGELIDEIIKKIPPPNGVLDAPLKALVFDSWFDVYKGAIVCIKVIDGVIEEGMEIKFFSTQKVYQVTEVGILKLERIRKKRLFAGEVGYLIAGIRDIQDVRIGDTITSAKTPCHQPLPGYKELKPVVFCSLYPGDGVGFDSLKQAIERLRLNDASFKYQEERSPALGLGYRCGFLGVLHSEIIQQRLEKEYDLDVIATAPRVAYKVHKKDGDCELIDNPGKFPDLSQIQQIEEPYIKATIIVPLQYIEKVINLIKTKKGIQKKVEYTEGDKVLLIYELPFERILYNFYDQLKSITKGYASFDYEFIGYKPTKLVKIDILINKELVDELSFFSYPEEAYNKAKELLVKLRKVIPRQQFEVVLQAAKGGKIIASERIAPLRKDVTAKCYGGDVTRKRKLLERQKEGKKRLKQIGRVNIPQAAFKAILELE
jgi:GTP-binding protein LepA